MNRERTSTLRRDLLAIYHHGLAAVEGRRSVRVCLEARPIEERLRLVAVGKAAGSMAEGAWETLGDRIESALVISRHGHDLGPGALPAIRFEASHPLPDRSSLAAGQTLLEFIADTPAGLGFLFLISGGTSSLVEVPRPGIDLAGLQRATQWLLGSGLSIQEINRVRARLSQIKGGRLATRLADRQVRQLLISDVPGDDPAVIGSGLLSVPPAGAAAAGRLGTGCLPDWLETMLGESYRPAVPAPVETDIVASSRQARLAAAERARDLGHPVRIHPDLLTGDAVETGQLLASALIASRPGIQIWGAETTVRLPDQPGRGGRCQSLALSAARGFDGRPDLLLLAAGSDGCDGPGPAAGALVDGQTITRGSATGLNPMFCLERADAGRFLEVSGDLVQTGPTATNVMDLIIGIKYGADTRIAY